MSAKESPSFIFRHLREEELPQWFDHLAECFPKTGKYYFEQHWQNDVDRSVERIYIAEEVGTGVIASTVKAYMRTIYVQGREVRCAAIGEVSTKERFRRGGLAQKLLDMAMSDAIASNIPLSILRASQFAPFYAKLGWQSVAQQTAYIAPSRDALLRRVGSHFADTKCVKIDPEAIGEWAERMCTAYTAYAKQYNGTFVRTPTYYSTWVAASLRIYPGVLLVALDKEGDMLGYLALQTKDRLIVKEFIPRQGLSNEDVTHLFSRLLLAALSAADVPDNSKLLVLAPLISHLPPLSSPSLSEQQTDPLAPVEVAVNDSNMYRVLINAAEISIPASIVGSADKSLSRHAFFLIDSY